MHRERERDKYIHTYNYVLKHGGLLDIWKPAGPGRHRGRVRQHAEGAGAAAAGDPDREP